jgi:hypothetical protein
MNLTFGFHRSSHVSPDCLKLFAPLPRRVNESPSNWQGLFCSASGRSLEVARCEVSVRIRSLSYPHSWAPTPGFWALRICQLGSPTSRAPTPMHHRDGRFFAFLRFSFVGYFRPTQSTSSWFQLGVLAEQLRREQVLGAPIAQLKSARSPSRATICKEARTAQIWLLADLLSHLESLCYSSRTAQGS